MAINERNSKGCKKSKRGTVGQLGERLEGQEKRRMGYDFLKGIWKKHNKTSLFQFYFKTTITSMSPVSTPLQLKLALQVFHSFRLCYCAVLKTSFSCGQQKVNEKEQYSSDCIFGLHLITLLE